MKKKNGSPEQIVRKLRKADQLRAEGKTVARVIAELGVSQPTYNRWRNRYGTMTVAEVKRLKALEKENGRLKLLVADLALHSLVVVRLVRLTRRQRKWPFPQNATAAPSP